MINNEYLTYIVEHNDDLNNILKMKKLCEQQQYNKFIKKYCNNTPYLYMLTGIPTIVLEYSINVKNVSIDDFNKYSYYFNFDGFLGQSWKHLSYDSYNYHSYNNVLYDWQDRIELFKKIKKSKNPIIYNSHEFYNFENAASMIAQLKIMFKKIFFSYMITESSFKEYYVYQLVTDITNDLQFMCLYKDDKDDIINHTFININDIKIKSESDTRYVNSKQKQNHIYQEKEQVKFLEFLCHS